MTAIPTPPSIVEDHPALIGVNRHLRDQVWPRFRDEALAYRPGHKLSRTLIGDKVDQLGARKANRMLASGCVMVLLWIPALFGSFFLFGWIGYKTIGDIGGFFGAFVIGPLAALFLYMWMSGAFRRYVDEGPDAPERQVVGAVAEYLGFRRNRNDFGEMPALNAGFNAMKTLKILPAIEQLNENIDDCFVSEGAADRIEMADITIYAGDQVDNVAAHYFRGLVIAFPNLVTTRGRTIAIGPRPRRAPVAKNLWALNGGDLPASFQELTLESETFNEAFDLFTDDQIGARRALTPGFMERVLALQEIINACSVDFLIEENLTTIAFDLRRNAFDYGTGQRLLEPEELRLVIQEFASILRVRDALKG